MSVTTGYKGTLQNTSSDGGTVLIEGAGEVHLKMPEGRDWAYVKVEELLPMVEACMAASKVGSKPQYVETFVPISPPWKSTLGWVYGVWAGPNGYPQGWMIGDRRRWEQPEPAA